MENKENLENSLDVLDIIPESTDHVEFVKKMTIHVINTGFEESAVKKFLKPYTDKNSIAIPLLHQGKNILKKSLSAPSSPSELIRLQPSKKVRWSECEDTEIARDILKKSSVFANLALMDASLRNEAGPRIEAPFFIRSLCRGITDAMNLITHNTDNITNEMETITNASSLIADLVKKDLGPSLHREYSLEDLGIVNLVQSVLDCIYNATRISQDSGERNNFVHEVFRTLISSEEIRKIIFESLCTAIRCSFSLFYVTFDKKTAILPPEEIDSLFHYFQLLTMVILCSSKDAWIEDSDVEKLKDLETISTTKLPMRLIATYMTRTTVYAMKYAKNSAKYGFPAAITPNDKCKN